jgi:antitoxin ParD1/3/4
LSTQSVYGRIK